MEEGAGRAETPAQAEREGEGEDAERGGEQHPFDDDDHRVGHRVEHLYKDRALVLRQARNREGEEQREDHQRQNGVAGGRSDRVRRRQGFQPGAELDGLRRRGIGAGGTRDEQAGAFGVHRPGSEHGFVDE